jgi:hypothetical protein
MHIESLTQDQPLSFQEGLRLSHLEAAIESGMESVERGWNKAWRSLQEIRNNRLYRATHATFADYCKERWGKSNRYINMLISAGEMQDSLSDLGTWVPTQEKHLRQLASLNPEQQAEAVIAVDVIASATPDRTPVTADFQKAAAAAKAKTPYEAIDNAIAQQETITVSDSDHPLYGRSGVATERQGLAVKIEVEPGKTTALLVNQITVGSEAPAPVKAIVPVPKQQPTNPAEGLQSAYDVAEMRLLAVTRYLRVAVQKLEQIGRPEDQVFLVEASKVLG